MKPWTVKEVDALYKFAHLGTHELALRLKRSEAAVRSKACRLGISLVDVSKSACSSCHVRPIDNSSLEAMRLKLCPICYRAYKLAQEQDKEQMLRLEAQILATRNRNSRLRKKIGKGRKDR